MERRVINAVIISDVHLGTYGCHAAELCNYLKSIKPHTLILNGDIIDGWQFSKRYFPLAHMQVIKEIINLMMSGTRIFYVTGNHDEMLRRYSEMQMGGFQLCDKLLIEINGKKTWVFHGDVFDATTKGSAKFIAKLGGYGYDLLILINSFINYFLKLFGKGKMSLSKKIKASVKKAVSWINNFEQTAAELAIENKYDYVVCGHIHQPQIKTIANEHGSVVYMYSGDWVENLTALELGKDQWTIYKYNPKDFETPVISLNKKIPEVMVLKTDIDLYITSLK